MSYPRVEVAAVTDVGLQRARNEDSIGIGAWITNSQTASIGNLVFDDEEVVLLTIADGLGGHPCGDRASRLVISALADRRSQMSGTVEIVAAIEEVNSILYSEMLLSPAWTSMGCTLVGLVVSARDVTVFNIGDSPLYEYVSGYLICRTIADAAEGEASTDAPNFVVTSTMGGTPTQTQTVSPHIWSEPLDGPRRFLLCSDGLTNFVSLVEMERVLQEESDNGRAAEQLLDFALAADAPDNVSVVVCTVDGR